jgi:hypothetical protein
LSAGGQSEQPSEVNSSTSTGTREPFGVDWADAGTAHDPAARSPQIANNTPHLGCGLV